ARNQQNSAVNAFCFREAQEPKLGLGTGGDRQPRMASVYRKLRKCERWWASSVANELLREILRKVVKTQDAGRSNYELRSLNDEINKQLREKRHWEGRIIA
ncbi:Isy1-like splicing factor, partial [Mycena galopus ATCC 62051]